MTYVTRLFTPSCTRLFTRLFTRLSTRSFTRFFTPSLTPAARRAAHCLHALLLLTVLVSAPRKSHAQLTTDTAAGSLPRGALRIDTLWSQSLGVRKRLVVYMPPSYATDTTRRFPVLYYLHGKGGNEDNWLQLTRMDRTMDSLIQRGHGEAIVVMPDGDDSWYTTWHTLPNEAACRNDTARAEPAAQFCVPWPHYDDYIARDLVGFIDRTYRTRAAARHRGIAGLSMGGYGAVTLALRYPDVFSAAASHSGVLAPAFIGPRPYAEPARWARNPAELREAAGTRYAWYESRFGRDTIGWYARDPGRLAERLVRAGKAVPLLYIDCGLSDPFIDQNRAFAATLRVLGVSHAYREPPGGHDWNYWRAHSPSSLVWLLSHVTPVATSEPPAGAAGGGAPRDPA